MPEVLFDAAEALLDLLVPVLGGGRELDVLLLAHSPRELRWRLLEDDQLADVVVGQVVLRPLRRRLQPAGRK